MTQSCILSKIGSLASQKRKLGYRKETHYKDRSSNQHLSSNLQLFHLWQGRRRRRGWRGEVRFAHILDMVRHSIYRCVRMYLSCLFFFGLTDYEQNGRLNQIGSRLQPGATYISSNDYGLCKYIAQSQTTCRVQRSICFGTLLCLAGKQQEAESSNRERKTLADI